MTGPLEIGGRWLRDDENPGNLRCVWCGREGVRETGFAPGLGEGVEVPLHMLPCAAQIVVAYRRWLTGEEHRRPEIAERARALWGESPKALLECITRGPA